MAEQAQEMVVDATPTTKAFMNKRSTHEDRIKKDEEELEKLKKEALDKVEEPATETKEEKAEDEEEPKNAEEKTFKKRYGDLRRHSQEKERDFQKQIDELKEQLSKATKKEMKLPKSDKDLDEWAQLHPDFTEIRESDDFHEWADEQPKWVQDALYENSEDARSAARAIDLYKSDRGIGKKDTSKSSKSAASEVKAKNTRSVPDVEGKSSKILESQVQKMSADEYEKNSDMIMEAIRSGNFVYDISGSAR